MTGNRPTNLPTYFLPLTLLAVATALLYLLAPILTPFLLAAILAYICDPLVERMQQYKVPRTLGVVLMLLLLLGAFVALALILLPLLQTEVGLLLQRLPNLLDWAKTSLTPWLKSTLGFDLQWDAVYLKNLLSENLQGAQSAAVKVLPSLKSGGMALISFVVNLLLVPVVLFYLLRDWGSLISRIDELIPRRWHAQVSTLAADVDRVLAEFLRGQLSVMLLMSVYYTLALFVAGLEFALPIGVVTGLLVFIPYLGMALGLTLATLAGLMQFSGIGGLIPIWIAFGIGQALEGMVVTPWLVGDRIGLHPVAVIFALLAFGQIFGFFGILLALPASAALLVGLRHLRQRYLESPFYGS
jgi:predicted PurR-regulated permease PerM